MRYLRSRATWLLVLLVVVVGAAELARSRTDPSKEVSVPTVVELDERDASRRITAAGLQPVVARRPSARPRGRVLRQDPGGGSLLEAEREVLLIVSSGPSAVPRLIGLPLPVAEKRLRDRGLKLSFRAVVSNRNSGVVVATEPEPGKPVVPGATVTVSVSSGPGPLAVPSLLWARADDAGASVRKTGFVARLFDVPSAEPAGIVVAQSPQPGAKLDRGSRVRIDVSTGMADGALPRTVDVPSVVGGALAAAQDQLEERGLVVRVEYALADAPIGEVLEQDPPAATTARRGANVRITVSAGREPSDRLEVIELVGLLEDGATSAIETAGFTPRVRRERTPDPAEVGIVVRQEPEAHTLAPQGGPITIYVGAAPG